ncbi:hypothetical protein B0J11DRAFT_603388 [Dendryphion nanum]|uniref:Uncharacterized protein n=1 Tax=Dendryphion nanum TaxID=256645 RepID=A0A9P9IPW3_9PLEO|nr:hypothetical protein B0J11DRAFT_603388 [Dendryphion nanum]
MVPPPQDSTPKEKNVRNSKSWKRRFATKFLSLLGSRRRKKIANGIADEIVENDHIIRSVNYEQIDSGRNSPAGHTQGLADLFAEIAATETTEPVTSDFSPDYLYTVVPAEEMLQPYFRQHLRHAVELESAPKSLSVHDYLREMLKHFSLLHDGARTLGPFVLLEAELIDAFARAKALHDAYPMESWSVVAVSVKHLRMNAMKSLMVSYNHLLNALNLPQREEWKTKTLAWGYFPIDFVDLSWSWNQIVGGDIGRIWFPALRAPHEDNSPVSVRHIWRENPGLFENKNLSVAEMMRHFEEKFIFIENGAREITRTMIHWSRNEQIPAPVRTISQYIDGGDFEQAIQIATNQRRYSPTISEIMRVWIEKRIGGMQNLENSQSEAGTVPSSAREREGVETNFSVRNPPRLTLTRTWDPQDFLQQELEVGASTFQDVSRLPIAREFASRPTVFPLSKTLAGGRCAADTGRISPAPIAARPRSRLLSVRYEEDEETSPRKDSKAWSSIHSGVEDLDDGIEKIVNQADAIFKPRMPGAWPESISESSVVMTESRSSSRYVEMHRHQQLEDQKRDTATYLCSQGFPGVGAATENGPREPTFLIRDV